MKLYTEEEVKKAIDLAREVLFYNNKYPKYSILSDIKGIELPSDEELAILFHNTYEKLALSFGYETRLDTKVFDANTSNGKLMIAVCKSIIEQIKQEDK